MQVNGQTCEDRDRTILFELTTTFNKHKLTFLDDLTYSDNEPDDVCEKKTAQTDRVNTETSKVTFNFKKRIDIK